jgi:hypothetical protein
LEKNKKTDEKIREDLKREEERIINDLLKEFD